LKAERNGPKLRALTMIFTRGSSAAMVFSIPTVSSVDALSAKMCS
jgi:hypothetical protein